MARQIVMPRPSAKPALPDARSSLHQHLMSQAQGFANDALIAHLLAGWALGQGSLPAHLGLGAEGFGRLLERHFPRLRWQPPTAPVPSDERLERALEQDDLVRLLTNYADREVAGAFAMARIVAEACLGGDHLWQDLGLPSRRELTTLMQRNFPRLAAENTQDMRWKKFLYRRLCEMEGLVACRSPSCEACYDYAACFAPAEPQS